MSYLPSPIQFLTYTGAVSTAGAQDIGYAALPFSGRYMTYTQFYWLVAGTGIGGSNIGFQIFTEPDGGGTAIRTSALNVNIQTASGITFDTLASNKVFNATGIYLRQMDAAGATGVLGARVGFFPVA